MDKFYCAAMLLCVIIDVHSMNMMRLSFGNSTSSHNALECTVEHDYSQRRIIKKSKAISLEASLKQKAYEEKYCDMVNPDGKTAITSNIDEGYDFWNSVGMFQLED